MQAKLPFGLDKILFLATRISLFDDIKSFVNLLQKEPTCEREVLEFARLFAINKWIALINYT